MEDDKNSADDEQIVEIGNSLDNVVDSIRQDLIAVNRRRKEDEESEKKEKEKIESLEDQNNCLQEQLIEDARKSEENIEFQLQKSVTQSINDELKKEDPIHDLFKSRSQRLIQHKQNQIKQDKKMEGDLRNELLDKSRRFEVDLDSSMCYTELPGQNQIKTVCEKIYKDRGITLVIKVN